MCIGLGAAWGLVGTGVALSTQDGNYKKSRGSALAAAEVGLGHTRRGVVTWGGLHMLQRWGAWGGRGPGAGHADMLQQPLHNCLAMQLGTAALLLWKGLEGRGGK
jgi:hypothetical protein